MQPDNCTGPYIGVVARDADMVRRLMRASDATSHVPVHEIWSQLHGERPPAALLIGASALDPQMIDMLHHAQTEGTLPPVVFRCNVGDATQISNIWRTKVSDANLVFTDSELPDAARILLKRPATGAYVLRRLDVLLQEPHPAVKRILGRMAEDSTLLGQNVALLAKTEAMSRTALYALFSRARLPSPEKIQLVFSLDAAFQATWRAAPLSQAARSAGYSSIRSLRSGFRRIGVGLRDVRKCRNRDWIFTLWLEHVAERPDLVRS